MTTNGAQPLTRPGPVGQAADQLIIEGARQNNLKNISLSIPHNAVTVITGISGSGKSSLAFDTLFAEGQWRYVESLSTYTRMFLDKIDRPDIDRLVNIRPAIAIEQANPVRTARSTVGTTTEVADYLRLLFAKIGRPTCPTCQQEGRGFQPGDIVDDLFSRFAGTRIMVLFPLPQPEEDDEHSLLRSLLLRGFIRVKCGDDVLDLTPDTTLPRGAGRSLCVVLDRLVVAPDQRLRLLEAMEVALHEGHGTCQVEVIGHGPVTYSSRFLCHGCGRALESARPIMLSFNHPLGACPECNGFGNILRYDEDLVVPNRNLSLAEGAIEPWTKPRTDGWHKQMLLAMKRLGIDPTTPYRLLSEPDRVLLWHGGKGLKGVQQFFESLEQKRYKLHVRVFLSRYRSPVLCPACKGARLKPDALSVRINGVNIHDVSSWTIDESVRWIQTLVLSPFEAGIAADILRQLTMKLEFLRRVGLGYLTLARQTRTLSGGEAQRIALGHQLGTRLVGTLYVLDEPTIGLHARDTAMLSSILRDLATVGNTVVVVEHDRQIMLAADHIVELGPASGEHGGAVVSSAPRARFLQETESITARYLRGDDGIPVPQVRRRGNGKTLILAGACEHNLKNLTVRLPLGMLVCVTGVSGSGKSTLVQDTLYRAAARAFRLDSLPMGRFQAIRGLEHLTGVRSIDQEPIGRTPRSNPITYVKSFDEIRRLYASLPEARRLQLTPTHFSFNARSGRCDACNGTGYEQLEMYFFEKMYVTCEVCHGQRFKPEILTIRYRGRTILDVLNMTVAEAMTFFADQPRLAESLHLLTTIGLGYLRLGQPATTLSGGEAQRLKIAAELKDRSSRDVLYILDEPTTGLHFDDIKKLLSVLNKLVNAGHTVLIVEHHLDVIKTADWIIDLGPEGGTAGGSIVAEGRPEQVAGVGTSHTGRHLRPLLTGSHRPAGTAGPNSHRLSYLGAASPD